MTDLSKHFATERYTNLCRRYIGTYSDFSRIKTIDKKKVKIENIRDYGNAKNDSAK